jgi:hypothetical protein
MDRHYGLSLLGNQADVFGSLMRIARRTIFMLVVSLSVLALAATHAPAANKLLPDQQNHDDSFAVKIDGAGIYSIQARERWKGRRAWLYSIHRFDTLTGKSRTVYDAGTKLLGDYRVGAGKIVARVFTRPGKLAIVSAPLDGTRSSTILTSKWKTTRNGGGCGTYLSPSSISPAGDVVIISDPIRCNNKTGKRKYLVLRADGTRAEVGAELSDPDQLDGMNDPIHTQLVGNRLLVNDGPARIYDLATGAMTVLWTDGVDHALIAQDGSLWLSAFGAKREGDFWTVLTRAASPLEPPAALASNSGPGEGSAERYLPLLCGDNVLLARAKINDLADDSDGDLGIFGWYGYLRLGGRLKLTLFSAQGNAIRSLPGAKMDELDAIGCDAAGVTIAGRDHDRAAYKRVAF